MTGRKKFPSESPDASLASLERKLRNAYIQKHLCAQMAEKKAQRISEELQERIADDLLNTSIKIAQQRHLESAKKRLSDAENYKKYLEKQISEKQRQKDYENCQQMLERQVLVEADKIREDKMEVRKAWEKIKMADQLLEQNINHLEMKEIIKQRSLDKEMLEDIQNNEYLRESEVRKEKHEMAAKSRLLERQKMIEKLSEALMAQNGGSSEAERRDLMAEIVAEEMRQADVAAHVMADMRRRKMAVKMATDLQLQMQIKMELRRRIDEEERKFVEDVMARIREDEILLQETRMKRMRKILNYRRELETLMEERKKKREKELEELLAWEERRRMEELRRGEEEREERKRLLREHRDILGDFVAVEGLSEEEGKIIKEGKIEKLNRK